MIANFTRRFGKPNPVWLLLTVLLTMLCASNAEAVDRVRNITCLAVSRDGKHVVSGGGSKLIVQSWPDFEVVQTLTVPMAQLHHAEFSADGKRLLLVGGSPGEYGNIALLSWPQLRTVWSRQLSDDVLYSAGFVENSSRMTAAGHDHSVYVFDPEGDGSTEETSIQTRFVSLNSHSKPVTSVCAVNDSSLLASCSVDGTVRIWDESSGQLQRTLSNHLKAVRRIAVRPTDESRLPMLASVSDDRTVRLWQPTIGRMVRFKRLNSAATAVDWHRAADRVIVGTRNGAVVAVNPDDLSVEWLCEAGEEWITEVACHPTYREVAVGRSDGVVKKLTLSK